MNVTDDDQALIDAARAALERAAEEHRQAHGLDPSANRDRLVQADRAEEYAATLHTFDPTNTAIEPWREAMYAGCAALQREADGWRTLAAAAVSDNWRTEFEAQADGAEHQAAAVHALQRRIADRDQAAEHEAER